MSIEQCNDFVLGRTWMTAYVAISDGKHDHYRHLLTMTIKHF